LGDLSEHFSKAELACHCCGTLKIEAALIDALELFRSLAGRPVVVHDAYRCPEHNEKVGGVNDSEHTRGMAADVSIPGLTLQQMFELALRVPAFLNGGIGVYDGAFLHLDVRPHSARWARVHGRYVAIGQLVTDPSTLLAKNAPLTPANPAPTKNEPT
jgi:zinc D-Ala-D-Ala carboxypeptidase